MQLIVCMQLVVCMQLIACMQLIMWKQLNVCDACDVYATGAVDVRDTCGIYMQQEVLSVLRHMCYVMKQCHMKC